MTFTEAAEAVLRKVGRALHYKKITQLAIDPEMEPPVALLGHVLDRPERAAFFPFASAPRTSSTRAIRTRTSTGSTRPRVSG